VELEEQVLLIVEQVMQELLIEVVEVVEVVEDLEIQLLEMEVQADRESLY
jgi:hypothetical protein